jgi:hypothetical protein
MALSASVVARWARTARIAWDRDELRDLRKLHRSSDSPFVFVTERGGPLTVGQLEYIVREAGLKARLPVPAHPHMLRHSAGYAVNAGRGFEFCGVQTGLSILSRWHALCVTPLHIRLRSIAAAVMHTGTSDSVSCAKAAHREGDQRCQLQRSSSLPA